MDKKISYEDMIVMGCKRRDISAYSTRKGARTFGSDGVVCPPSEPLELRMWHIIEKRQATYIYMSEESDSF